jgi:putative oxidoreductase
MSTAGILVLRLTIAIVSIAHGMHVLFGTFGGDGTGVGVGGLDAQAIRFSQMGLTPGFILAVLAGVTQLAAGVLLAVGYLTRWAALALAGYTAILAWRSQVTWGFFLNWVGEPGRGHGVEYSLVLIAACLLVALAGGGDWSFDGRRSRRAAYVAAGRARLRRTKG